MFVARLPDLHSWNDLPCQFHSNGFIQIHDGHHFLLQDALRHFTIDKSTVIQLQLAHGKVYLRPSSQACVAKSGHPIEFLVTNRVNQFYLFLRQVGCPRCFLERKGRVNRPLLHCRIGDLALFEAESQDLSSTPNHHP